MSQKCHERPHALPDLQVRALLAWRAMSRDRAGQILTPDCKDCPPSCSPEPIGHGQGTVWRRDEHVIVFMPAAFNAFRIPVENRTCSMSVSSGSSGTG